MQRAGEHAAGSRDALAEGPQRADATECDPAEVRWRHLLADRTTARCGGRSIRARWEHTFGSLMIVCLLIPRFQLTIAAGDRAELLQRPTALAPELGGAQQVGDVSIAPGA